MTGVRIQNDQNKKQREVPNPPATPQAFHRAKLLSNGRRAASWAARSWPYSAHKVCMAGFGELRNNLLG